ncbi:MAG TPA: hypothetical protein DEB39_03180 [Planctomycetaceae bacterium]|nr:hypothetical protein [Planctomycetaceae bacterium]
MPANDSPPLPGAAKNSFWERVPLYPFFLAVYPVLFLAAHNGVPLDRIVLFPLILSAAITLLLFGLLNCAVGSIRKTGAVVALWVVLFFWSYPLFDVLKKGTVIWIGSDAILLFFLLYPIGTIWLLRRRSDYRLATRMLNTMTLVLLVLVALSAVGNQFVTAGKAQRADKSENTEVPSPTPKSPVEAETNSRSGAVSTTTRAATAPDVFVILLDAYVGQECMQEVYGFDNGEFLDYLREKKFSLAKRSTSNYPATMFSLPFFFAMDYHDENYSREFHDEFGRGNDVVVAKRTLSGRAIRRFLANGYRSIFISPAYLCGKEKAAGIEIHGADTGGDPEFSAILWGSTLLRYFGPPPGVAEGYRKHTVKTFELIEAAARERLQPGKQSAPCFVFAYVSCPHSPFVFRRDGSALPRHWEGLLSNALKKEYCVEQHEYVNRRVKEIIDLLTADPDRLPIIVVFSDHSARTVAGSVAIRNTSREGILDTFSNLVAVHVPEGKTDLLPDGLSNVNVMRVLFNHLDGTNEPLMPDKYYSLREGRCREVTDIVVSALANPPENTKATTSGRNPADGP